MKKIRKDIMGKSLKSQYESHKKETCGNVPCLEWGSRGRRFKSFRPDQILKSKREELMAYPLFLLFSLESSAAF
jgi:hypothetical protein